MMFQGLCNLVGSICFDDGIFSRGMHALNILFICFYTHQNYGCNDMSGKYIGINLVLKATPETPQQEPLQNDMSRKYIVTWA